MRDVLMWSSLAAFVGCCYFAMWISRKGREIKASLSELQLRADELSEASALIEYGAYQEAVEVLRRAKVRETT